MAENKNTITVKFKPEGDKDLVNAIKALGRETRKLVQTQASLAREGKKVKNTQDKLTDSQKKAAQQTRILGGTLAVIRSKLLLLNFALGLGITQMSRMVTAFSKVESMERAFNTLTGATEDSTQAIIKLREATNNTMSEFDLFQQANNAMILGVSRNSDEMAEMFDIAQRLGRALGRDTASSVESLVTGIGRQSRLMLDNIGIIVKSEEAYEAYAEKIGLSASSLDDAQKKQAFLEATMISARQKIKDLGEETLTAQDTFDQLGTSMNRLGTAISKRFAPLFASLAEDIGKVADNMSEFLDPTIDRQSELNKLLDEYNTLMGRGTDEIDKQASSVEDIFANRIPIDELTIGLNPDQMRSAIDLLREQISEYNDLMQSQEMSIRLSKEAQDVELATAETIEKVTSNGIASQIELGKVKRENMVQDLRNAALSGQSAKDAMKAVIKAESMEAVAGYISSVLKDVPFPVNLVLAAAGGAVVSGLIDKGLAQFEQGGLVGGQRHSQGGTVIEAERGEFVMSRQAVQSVGLETMNQINQGASPGLTINVSAPLVDETILDVIIPKIQQAQRQNLA
jgi:hypothetical protein